MASAAATAALLLLKPDAPKCSAGKKEQALHALQSAVPQLTKTERVSLRDGIEASLISIVSDATLTPPLRHAYLGCLDACASADDRIVFRIADGLLALLQQSPPRIAPILAFSRLLSCVSHSLTGKCSEVLAVMMRIVKDAASSPLCRTAAFACIRSLVLRFSPALAKTIPDIIKVCASCPPTALPPPPSEPPKQYSWTTPHHSPLTPPLAGGVQDAERQSSLHRRQDFRC